MNTMNVFNYDNFNINIYKKMFLNRLKIKIKYIQEKKIKIIPLLIIQIHFIKIN